LSNISPIVPPATLRKVLPATPSKNLVMIMVSMFCATAHGIMKMKTKAKEII